MPQGKARSPSVQRLRGYKQSIIIQYIVLLRLFQAREFPRLFQSFGFYDPGSFLYGQDLIGFDFGEFLGLLRRGPLDFDRIDLFRVPEAEVKAQIALGHYAGSAVDLVYLRVFSCHHAGTGADCSAVTMRPN